MLGIWRGVAVAVLILLIAGCGGGGTLNVGDGNPHFNNNDPLGQQPVAVQAVLPPVFTDPTPDDGVTFTLIAGQTNNAGGANIWTDDEFLYMHVWSIDDWVMSGMHLYVGSTPPNDQGNPGSFPNSWSFDPGKTDFYIDPIPLSELEIEFKSEVFIALHVNVNSDTSWGGDWNNGNPQWDYGWDKKWGGFMGVCLPPNPVLPADAQAFDAIRFGSFSYWDTRFADQDLALPPGEFFISDDKYYVGWCGDMARVMYQNHLYNAFLYSSYDPALPTNPNLPITNNGNLEFINFMINERRNPTGGGPFDGVDWTVQANYMEFQDAVWYFTNEFIPDPGSLAESLAQYAIDNGDNYIPCEGEWYSIVLYPETANNSKDFRAQLMLIEVDP